MSEITTNIDDLMGQPFYGALGNPTTPGGAGMVPLGQCPRAEIAAEFFVQTLDNELGQAVGAGFEAFRGGTVTLTLKRRSATIMAAVFKSIVAGAASLGFNPQLQARDQLTLALIPKRVADPTDPTEAEIRWIPNVIFQEMGAFIAKVEQSNQSDTFALSGILGRAVQDQAGQDINANYQIFFRGSAVDALGGMPANPWTLPSQSA